MRYIGLLMENCANTYARSRMLLEMFCRTCKNRLRVCLRNLVLVTESSANLVVSRFLFDILGQSSKSNTFWYNVSPKHIENKFKVSVSEECLQEIRTHLCGSSISALEILLECICVKVDGGPQYLLSLNGNQTSLLLLII